MKLPLAEAKCFPRSSVSQGLAVVFAQRNANSGHDGKRFFSKWSNFCIIYDGIAVA